MELLALTDSELARLRCLQRVVDGYLTQREAAVALAVSERQIRRLVRIFVAEGAPGLASRKRGRSPNNRIDDATRAVVLERYRGEYDGFGPTLLAETLAQRDGILLSRETLRIMLRGEGLWKAKRQRRQAHPLRDRRPRFGDLIQMDGSPHDWFEERAPKATLLLAIDDATSRITAARFETAETTNGYFALIKTHIEKYGRFCAAYTDKHSIFRYSGRNAEGVTTQAQRALDELDITLVCANSPQAKGRVERANRTFQDRLVKALRLAKIDALEDANVFLIEYVTKHNEQFGVEPAHVEDAHRSAAGFDLALILCTREERIVTKNRMFQFDDQAYVLIDAYSRRNLSTGSRITIRRFLDGSMSVHHGDHVLDASAAQPAPTVPIVGSKDLNEHLDKRLGRRIPDPAKVRLPAANHPWRRTYKPAATA